MSKRSIVVVAALSLFTTGNATVWYVHPDSTMNCIQYGLDSCSTADTVLVGPGTYHENIVWPATDGIDLISETGPNFTIIDGDSAGRVISIVVGINEYTVINGFTIRNGYSEEDGAAIHCDGASPTITGNVITNNRVYGGYNGGAIACMNNASPDIHANTISNNRSTWGGGILCYNMSMPNITDNTIDNNYADSVGGGITCYGGCDANITDNTVTNNYAYWGGGIAIGDYSSPAVRRNTISANDAAFMGGGIYCFRYSSPLIEDNEVLNNDCSISDNGAGIRCSVSPSAVIKHCIISNNYLGISIYESMPDIDSCIIGPGITGIKIFEGANPTINWCNIVGNTGYGLISQNSAVTINAENNWWGDATGPYHSSQNPGGLGDRVAGNVDFSPWLLDSVIGVAVEESEISRPLAISLQITPNPFTKLTQIRYSIQDSRYSIQEPTMRIYDASGRVVKSFDLGSSIQDQESAISWNGTDQSDRRLPAGVYFVRLSAGGDIGSHKILLIK